MADAQWEPDGTQPLSVPRAWGDPVAGLITGSSYEQEPFRIDVAKPVMPDLTDVRRAVDAVLSEEVAPRTPIPAARRRPPVPAHTPGIVAPNPRPGWPRSPAVRQLPGLRGQPPPAAQRPAPVPPGAAARRPSGSSAGVGAIIVMLLVAIVIVVVIISSLVATISSIFD